MSALTRDQFIACLKKSRAMEGEAVDSWMSRVDDEDPRKIATKLVRDRMLTPWQAKLLLSGRSRLTLGNYRLLSRINRDELGDRFEAIHSQLGRKVVIQIFPSTIDKDNELRSRVLKVMQQMTELDHRSLVHVYDVDQEGDRYFVVTEFVDGTPLSELPRGDLKDTDVASIIGDIITGIKHAHREGVIHGNIVQENILVTADRHAKLQGLSTSAVRSAMSDLSGKLSSELDFAAISRFGQSVLQEVPPRRRGDGYDRLVDLLKTLSTVSAEKVDDIQLKLSQWTAEYAPKIQPATPVPPSTPQEALTVAASSSDSALAMAKSVDPLVAQQEGVESRTTALPAAPLTKKEKGIVPEPDVGAESFLLRMWNQKRGISIAALAAVLLALTGGAGAATYLLKQPATAPVGGDRQPNGQNEVNAANAANGESDSSKKSKTGRRRKEFKLERLAAGDGLLSGERSADALDPVATKRKFEELYAQRQAAAAKSAKPKPAKSKVAKSNAVTAEPTVEEQKTPTSPARASGAAGAAKPAVEKVAAAQKNATVAAGKNATNGASKPAGEPSIKPDKKTASKSNKKPAAPAGNPFAKLPEHVDLPPSTDTGDLKIADIVIDKKYLMGLELATGPEVCKNKFAYDLKRSAQDKQLWDVRLKRRKRDEPLPVAQIQKTPTELLFRWLPAAEKYAEANFIRNCKIKLSAAKDLGWLGLRKPVAIENFAFENGRASLKADVNLKWLPNPQAIRIELSPFTVEQRVPNSDAGKVYFAPREVAPKAPGAIYFRQRDDLRFFFVEVGVEIRSKLKMQGQMFVLGASGTPQPLRKLNEILDLADVLAVRKGETERVQAMVAQAKNKEGVVKIFPELKDEGNYKAISGKAKQATDLATRQALAGNEYVKIVKNLAGRRIPFEIYFDLDGQRIPLARSIAQEFVATKNTEVKK